MTALEAFEQALIKLYFIDKFNCKVGRPGEVIASLSTEVRKQLSKLTSIETQNMRVLPEETISLHDYNSQYSCIKKLFDKRILKRK